MARLDGKQIGSTACVLGGGALWGLIGVFSSLLADRGLSSMQLTVCRGAVTVILLLPLILLTDPRQFILRRRDFFLLIGMGLSSVTLFNYCYFETIRRLGSLAMASALSYTSPVFVAILSAVLFHEKLRAVNIAAIFLSLAGCACVVGLGPGAAPSLPGVLFGLGAGLSYGLYSILGKLALRQYRPLTVILYTFLFGTVFSLPLTDWEGLVCGLRRPDTLWLAVLFGIICSVLPYILYTRGLAQMPSNKASVLATVEPCVAAVAGAVLFHQKLTAVMLLGLLLVVLAIALLNSHVPSGRR